MMILAKILGVIWIFVLFVYGATLIEVKYLSLRNRHLGLSFMFDLIVLCCYCVTVYWYLNLF